MGGGATLFAFIPLIVQIITTPCGIRKYKVTGSAVNTITKMAFWSSIQDVNGNREGYLFGKWFYSYYEKHVGRDRTDEIFIIAHKSITKKLVTTIGSSSSRTGGQTLHGRNNFLKDTDSDSEEEEEEEKKNIMMYMREGGFWRLEYKPLKYIPRVRKPLSHQKTIIDQLLTDYDERGSSTALIYGRPGTGKSMVGELIAQSLLRRDTVKSVSYVDTFNPSTPNDTFYNLYQCIEPTNKQPLIVVLEEIDILLEKIHRGETKPHREYSTLITDKSSWNQFFDRFDRGLYPHVILLMTTNRPISWFEQLDNSYMRQGRCNLQICADSAADSVAITIRGDSNEERQQSWHSAAGLGPSEELLTF